MQGSFTEKIKKPKVQKFGRLERDPKRDKNRKQDFSRDRNRKRGFFGEDTDR